MWMLHGRLKSLGANYIARLLYYAQQYGAHFMMNTEVRPYQPREAMAQSGASFNSSTTGSSGASTRSRGSFIDNFFSQYNQSPGGNVGAVNQASQGNTSGPRTNVSGKYPTAATNNGTTSLFSSALKFGATAIQSSMQSPKLPADGANLTNKSGQQNVFGAVSSSSRSVSTSSSRSVNESPLDYPKSRVSSGNNNLGGISSKASSPESIPSDTDFDFVKQDETVASYVEDNDSASLISKTSAETHIHQRRSSWFNWKKSSASSFDTVTNT